MYVRAHVYSVHDSLRLYVSARTRKRIEGLREERKQEKGRTVDRREERGNPE